MTVDQSHTPSATMPSRPDDIAAAIERRLQQQREQEQEQESTEAAEAEGEFGGNYERRQEFRRLIDPGILRPNAKELAFESLRTLRTLADNILAHPGETKYYKFKPTNTKIKQYLVDPKGTLEYAVAMGFRPQIENFQPFYVFEQRYMNDLKIGLAMINETLEREASKQERVERSRREAKEAEAAEKEKLKRQFLDDRKSTLLRQQREREARAATSTTGQSPISTPPRPNSRVTPASRIRRGTPRMGGTGRTLNGQVVTDTDEGSVDPRHGEGVIASVDRLPPPPYEGPDEDAEGEEDESESEGE